LPAVALFLFGLAIRWLFQTATPDGGGCWHIGFQGDAPIWQDLAGRAANGIYDVELVLPWRPPGMVWAATTLWNGEGATVWPLRVAVLVCGALIGPLVWWLLRPRLSAGVAFLAACFCAASSNLMLLSSGLHVETPYLCFVLLSLFDFERLARQPSWHVAMRWGFVHGALCLLRAEHSVALLFFCGALLLLRTRWWVLLLGVVTAAVPIVPYQLHANRLVAEFNAGDASLPATNIVWRPAALSKLRDLPVFQQGPMFVFVSETMRVRGRKHVEVADLAVIEEAFGVYPEPLQPRFVALQGGYNFWVANTAESAGEFTTAPNDRPPPLAGGAQRFPSYVQTNRPKNGQFALSYPPHLHAFVHGVEMGFAEIGADPVAAAGRIVGKVWSSLAGATGGFGGYALPLGLSGERRPVDIVTATGVWPQLWRVLVLLVAGWGIWQVRRERIVIGLLVFSLARYAVICGFYGYARHGALCLPLVMVGLAVACHRGWQRWSRRNPDQLAFWSGAVLLGLLLVAELVRCSTVAVAIDGQPWLGSGGGSADHTPHTIVFSSRGD